MLTSPLPQAGYYAALLGPDQVGVQGRAGQGQGAARVVGQGRQGGGEAPVPLRLAHGPPPAGPLAPNQLAHDRADPSLLRWPLLVLEVRRGKSGF